jgi:hypothetical protein
MALSLDKVLFGKIKFNFSNDIIHGTALLVAVED